MGLEIILGLGGGVNEHPSHVPGGGRCPKWHCSSAFGPIFYLPLTGLHLGGGGDIELCPGMELHKQ